MTAEGLFCPFIRENRNPISGIKSVLPRRRFVFGRSGRIFYRFERAARARMGGGLCQEGT
jgi:hypothetical protein